MSISSDRYIINAYDFKAGPNILWTNATKILGNMKITSYYNCLTKTFYHNLCSASTPSDGIRNCVGLRPKLLIQARSPNPNQ